MLIIIFFIYVGLGAFIASTIILVFLLDNWFAKKTPFLKIILDFTLATLLWPLVLYRAVNAWRAK